MATVSAMPVAGDSVGGQEPLNAPWSLYKHWVLRTGYSSNLHLITFPKGPGLARGNRQRAPSPSFVTGSWV
ncbi:unnamed protein product [Gadus morhua 'NCC']